MFIPAVSRHGSDRSGARSLAAEFTSFWSYRLARKAALVSTTASTATYPDTDVARAVAGLKTACVDLGSCDLCASLGRAGTGRIAEQVRVLTEALAAFAKDLGPLTFGVCPLTMSEFARRPGENGSGGADHGYGNAALVMGAASSAGRSTRLTDFALDHGDLAGTTDNRSLLAELLVARTRAADQRRERGFPRLHPQEVGLARPR